MQMRSRLESLQAGLNLARRATITVALEGPSLRLTASRGNRIIAWVNLPFNPALVSDDLVTNPKDLGTVIRNGVRRLNYWPSAVLAIYPGLRSISRIISIPKRADIKADIVLNREARRLIGPGVDQSYLSWQCTNQDQTTQQFYLVAVPRARLDSYIQALMSGGLRPKAVDLKALALARALNTNTAVLVDMEHTGVGILVFLEYVPQVTSSIPMEETLSLDEGEMGQRLADEVRRALDYLQQRNPNLPVNQVPIFLTGAHPLVETGSFAASLGDALGTKVQPPTKPSIQFSDDFPLTTYLANVGLLLRRG